MYLNAKLVWLLFCTSACIFGTRVTVAQASVKRRSSSTLTASNVVVVKRSSHHIHHHKELHFKVSNPVNVAKEEGKYFVSLLFSKYGNRNKTLQRNELLDLFHNLGLNDQQTESISQFDKQYSKISDLNVKGQEPGEKQRDTLNHQSDKDASKRSIREYHKTHTKCVSVTEMLQAFHLENKDEITQTDFLYLSPAIIYQLDTQNCTHITHNAVAESSRIHNEQNESDITFKDLNSIPTKVWGFSFAAVLVISLVGLLGVAVIPIMQKVFYNHLLQFLVALAVGALMGDALLHLLPHAIGGSNHENPNFDHKGMIWKGLCGLLGIFFFFIMERILTIITEAFKKKKLKHKLKRSTEDIDNSIGSKLSSHSEEVETALHPINSDDDNIEVDPKVIEEESMMVSVKPGHHGHSHIDGPMPRSVASIAWMVILGDGIHNFSDGLAIGAAFANSITGGFSTSIAVFCHELPHEIGDFAVLLRAGMSAKQAIVYNCVSSILCFVGMAVGVALGNIHDVTLWIFAGVGGIFIYIALVDMLPEMTSDTKKGDNSCLHLFLQCMGMITGSSIMLLIAIFEEDLLNLLD